MRATACGLNPLGEKSNSTTPFEHTQHILNAHKIGLIQILGNDPHSNKNTLYTLFEDVLISANDVDITTSKAVNGINEFKP